ncbi:rhodanese-like domain-containing protein [candidate division FCPU426 bacterium]|nr:rhodanese-like domain-containing protein [candidate division FCPU426 bacterium]
MKGKFMAAALFLAVCALPACGQKSSAPSGLLNPVITAEELVWRLQTDKDLPYILDVRTAEYYAYPLGYLPGAHHCPVNALEQIIWSEKFIPRDQEIVVVCQTGDLTPSAVSILERNGYTTVRALKGGIVAVWQFLSATATSPSIPLPRNSKKH